MKMAKSSDEEWKKCMDFANELDERVKSMNDRELGAWVREHYVWLGRTIYGFRVLVDNACDPAKDTLEWRPEIAAAIAAYKPAASASNQKP